MVDELVDRRIRNEAVRAVALGLVALVGCGSDERPRQACEDLGWPHYCRNPMILALRTTETLTPSSEEVLFHYRLLRPIYEQMPLLALTEANNHYFYYENTFGVTTAYAPLVEAWSAGERSSDDPAVDALLVDGPADLTITTLDDPSAPAGYTSFWLETSVLTPFSWRVLRARLAAIPDTNPGGMETPGNGMDVTLSSAGTDSILDLVLGWGDCELGCIDSHHWRATVHADGTVDIADLGGAEPEPFLYENAAALPPLPDL